MKTVSSRIILITSVCLVHTLTIPLVAGPTLAVNNVIQRKAMDFSFERAFTYLLVYIQHLVIILKSVAMCTVCSLVSGLKAFPDPSPPYPKREIDICCHVILYLKRSLIGIWICNTL